MVAQKTNFTSSLMSVPYRLKFGKHFITEKSDIKRLVHSTRTSDKSKGTSDKSNDHKVFIVKTVAVGFFLKPFVQ
jgi:hypothetical protein